MKSCRRARRRESTCRERSLICDCSVATWLPTLGYGIVLLVARLRRPVSGEEKARIRLVLGALAGHMSLESVFIGNSEVSDLSPLADLEIRVLSAYSNAISDVAPIASWPDIEYVDLSGNAISDLSPLVGVPWSTVDGCADVRVIDNPLDTNSTRSAGGSGC